MAYFFLLRQAKRDEADSPVISMDKAKSVLCYINQMVLYIFYMNKQRGPKKGMSFQGNHRYEFGSALSRERIKRGLTQAELAKRLDSTARVISHFEREV